jgi:hypothetical protein
VSAFGQTGHIADIVKSTRLDPQRSLDEKVIRLVVGSATWRGLCHENLRAWRALIARPVVSTREICAFIWPRLSEYRSLHYERARQAALELGAERIERAGGGRGRPHLWKLSDQDKPD